MGSDTVLPFVFINLCLILFSATTAIRSKNQICRNLDVGSKTSIFKIKFSLKSPQVNYTVFTKNDYNEGKRFL